MILRFNDYDLIIILPDDQTRFWAFQSTILWCRRIIHPVVGPVLVGGRLDPRLGVDIRVSDELPSEGAGSFPGATVADTDGTSQSQELGAVHLPVEASRRVSVFGDVLFIFLAGTEFVAKGEEEPLPVCKGSIAAS